MYDGRMIDNWLYVPKEWQSEGRWHTIGYMWWKDDRQLVICDGTMIYNWLYVMEGW